MIIIGAGLSGLIAGRILQTKFIKPTIFEAQASLPNNHSAVLRFRTSVVGDRTAIPFRRVSMIKCLHPVRNPVADALTYSYKCSGSLRSDRSINSGSKAEERFIAPLDFIPRLAADLDIKFGVKTSHFSSIEESANAGPIISTIPMPALMHLLDYDRTYPEFHSVGGTNISFTVKDCDAYVSVYDPAPDSMVARISVTGDKCVCEVPHATYEWDDGDHTFVVTRACELLGIHPSAIDHSSVRVKHAQYSKILPIDEKIRKDFMHWATERFNIYSLGRFATWKPGLLLDDIVKDVDQITTWARAGNAYERKRVALNHNIGYGVNV